MPSAPEKSYEVFGRVQGARHQNGTGRRHGRQLVLLRREMSVGFIPNLALPRPRRHPRQLGKGLAVTSGVVVAFFVGVPIAKAAIVGRSILLLPRSVNPRAEALRRCMARPRTRRLVVAMASTLAGNLTLIGSVANLIVAERAGVTLSFLDHARIGVPVTLVGTWCLTYRGRR
jgi:Na+/H+ antiporter NhaD/arsenite permease-like protein